MAVRAATRKAGEKPGSGFLYQTVANLIAKQIESGIYKVGDVLPKEEQIARNINVSRNTLRHALAILESQGLILRKKKLGTVVIASRPRADMTIDMTELTSFGQVAERTHFHPGPPQATTLPEDLAAVCGETAGGLWTRVGGSRTDTLTGLPYSYTAFYFPERFAEVAKLIGAKTGLVYRQIEDTYGVRVDRVDLEILAAHVDDRVAAALDLKHGAVLLKLMEVMREADGAVIEVVEAYYRPDSFRYRSTIRPTART